MRKLTLNPEDLAVESFETATAEELLGTVRGAQEDVEEPAEPIETDTGFLSIWTCQTNCNQLTCGGSCGVTCATCNDPTCNSCFQTRCWTGNSPVCCAIV
ncbi:MAG TPA: hypothetical protein VFR81_05910 [Longimicrobium sp.]|nr:hypothetical protein [Longimicrobium sp.]